MARRARIDIDAKTLDIYPDLIAEITRKGYPVDENTTQIYISALARYTEKISTDLDVIANRLQRFITINGNKRVSKKELCHIIKISRPTLNRWIEKKFISWDYFGGSFELLHKWLFIIYNDSYNAFKRDNNILQGELLNDNMTDVFEAKGLKFAPIALIRINTLSIPYYCDGCKSSVIFKDDEIKNGTDPYKFITKCANKNKVNVWEDCGLVSRLIDSIRYFKIDYQNVRYKKHNYGFPSTMNLLAFLQQIQKNKKNF